jgi:hypothetical protein
MTKLQFTRWVIEINFYISALLLIAGGVLCIFGNSSLFTFNEDLYGALDNNIRINLFFLAVSEAFLVVFCLYRKNFRMMMAVGFFLLTIIPSLSFYQQVNGMEIDPTFNSFFLYVGLSHILFGFIDKFKASKL